QYIIGRKDNSVTIYDQQLKNITPQGTQSAFPFYRDGISYNILLINNEVKYMTQKGKLTDSLEPVIRCGFEYYSTSRSLIIKKDTDLGLYLELNIVGEEYFSYLDEKNVKDESYSFILPLTELNDYDEVTFINN